MTMQEYLERDREKVLIRLQAAGSQTEAATIVNDELDRILLLYNEKCQVPARREAAAWMIQTAKGSAQLIDTVGNVQVYEKIDTSGKNAAEENQKFPVASVICLFLALVCGAGAFSLTFVSYPGNLRITDMILAVILAIAAPAFGWLAGLAKGHSDAEKTGNGRKRGVAVNTGNTGITGSQRKSGRRGTGTGKNAQTGQLHTEVGVNAERILTCLQNVIYAMDHNLDQIMTDPANPAWTPVNAPEAYVGNPSSGAAWPSGDIPAASATAASVGTVSPSATPAGPSVNPAYLTSSALPVTDSQLALFSELLEAAYSGDGAYALEKIMKVKYYLHQNRIETADYDGSNEEMFDFMPSGLSGKNGKARTIRPALVCSGQVIQRGMAIR